MIAKEILEGVKNEELLNNSVTIKLDYGQLSQIIDFCENISPNQNRNSNLLPELYSIKGQLRQGVGKEPSGPVTMTLTYEILSQIIKSYENTESGDVSVIADRVRNLSVDSTNDNWTSMVKSIKDQLGKVPKEPSGINTEMMLKFVGECRDSTIVGEHKLFIEHAIDMINQRNKTRAWMEEQLQMSEMALQQMVYPPFTSIVAFFEDRKNGQPYLADEDVKFSSRIWRFNGFPNGSVGFFKPKPDGGLRVVPQFNALCLLELKRGSDDLSKDIKKCALGLSITAKWMRKGGCKDLIQLPFVVGNGESVELYVVRLLKEESCHQEATNESHTDPSVPKVHLIQEMRWYERDNDLATTLSMLAYLLGKALKQLTHDNLRKARENLEKMKIREQGNNIASRANSNAKSAQSKKSTQSKSNNGKTKKAPGKEQQNEKDAVLAASLGGGNLQHRVPVCKVQKYLCRRFLYGGTTADEFGVLPTGVTILLHR